MPDTTKKSPLAYLLELKELCKKSNKKMEVVLDTDIFIDPDDLNAIVSC